MRRIEDPDLIRIGIDADVRCVLLADHQQAHYPIASVLATVCAAFAARKRDHFALRKLAPSGRCAKRERSAEDDEQFLALYVVVEHHGASGLKLVEAHPELVGARLFA